MGELDSDIKRSDRQEPVPLSGDDLEAAIKAMEAPQFLPRLIARIMKLARMKGFQSPFEDEMNLPGGKSAADLAVDIVEKSLNGRFAWNRQKFPDFSHFCLSRTESILSNWLLRNWRVKSVSPLITEDDEGGIVASVLSKVPAEEDLYFIVRTKEGETMGDNFLEDFALSLPDASHEQAIAFAVFDDRECANRSYCRGKLNLLESDYDAAIKRLLRKLPAFAKEWKEKHKVSIEEWKDAQ